MKKRFLALLLAVCIGVSVLVLPASAAGSNTAVQTAVTLGAFSTEEAAGLSTPLTRGQLAKLLVAFSAYHDNANTQGSIGTPVYRCERQQRLCALYPHCSAAGLDERLHRRFLPPG